MYEVVWSGKKTPKGGSSSLSPCPYHLFHSATVVQIPAIHTEICFIKVYAAPQTEVLQHRQTTPSFRHVRAILSSHSRVCNVNS